MRPRSEPRRPASARARSRGSRRAALILCPRGEQATVVRHESLLLVRGKRGRDGVDEQSVEGGALDPVQQDLVQVRQLRGAEIVVLVDLEVLVGELPVLAELLGVAEVVE